MQPRSALRLARFNHMESDDTTHFTGLASPAAAATAAGLVWMGQTHGRDGANARLAACVAADGARLLDDFPFPLFEFQIDHIDRRVPFVRMLLVVAVLGLIALDPPLAIWDVGDHGLSGLYNICVAQIIRAEGAKDYDKADLH